MDEVVVMLLVKAIVIGSIVSAFLMGIACVLKGIAEELRRQEGKDGDK